MASPVIINSSSPNSIRLPTITPPSRRGSVNHVSTSSEGLPSPSTFMKRKASILKSGSRVQAIPANAGFGFATAGSLWRESIFQDGAAEDEVRREPALQPAVETVVRKARSEESADGQIKGTGKLKKPKKTTRDRTEPSAQKAASKTLEFQDFVCENGQTRSKGVPAVPKPANNTANPIKQAAPERKPSVHLSAFTFGVYDLGMQTQAPAAATTAKKSRKATAPKEPKQDVDAASKPRKRKPKSETVILNSDDPAAEGPVTEKPAEKSVEVQAKPKRKRVLKAQSATSGADTERGEIAPEAPEPAVPQDLDMSVEKSAYFATTGAIRTAKDAVDMHKPQSMTAAAQEAFVADAPQELAPPRKIDWTPVKNTKVMPQDRHAVQLTDLLGGFGYVDANAKKPSVERTVSGEAVTKRRCIELGDAAAAAPAPRKAQAASEKPEPKAAKKPAGRKKLQTITALATAAYQLEPCEVTEQSTVSEFFAPQKEKATLGQKAAPTTEKPKKSRKPRKKKVDGVEGDQADAAPPRKAKKAKVKFSEADFRTKLYSPARATEEMKQQDFLFGTSSQLAVDESPAFIRDMQAAVQASEMDAGRSREDTLQSQIDLSGVVPSQLPTTPRRGKSCAKVPTAPHGTCLSLEQAHRELWCMPSRDDEGGFLRDVTRDNAGPTTLLAVAEGHDHGVVPSAEQHFTHAAKPVRGSELHDTEGQADSQYLLSDKVTALGESADQPPESGEGQQAVVNLSNTSPIAAEQAAEDSAIAFDDKFERSVPQEQPDADPAEAYDEDTWMLISSDGPEPQVKPGRSTDADFTDTGRRLELPSVRRDSAPLLSPGRKRSVLQPLDANAGIPISAAGKEPSADQARLFKTTASDQKPKSTAGRPRGRPRKDTSATFDKATSPKKRGRPPKQLVIASDPSPEAAKFKKLKAAVSDSQPTASPSGWLDVDEISDSDSPVTSSPPRRRASASPPTVPALDITVDGSPLAKLKEKAPVIVATTSTFKPGEPQWPAIREQIFLKISSRIKDAPRNIDPSKPSWYQKILMYDPITLEELTAWLNEQGLRIEVQKQKPKVKKRGRKKKDADGKLLEKDDAVEWEVHEELLQPWMVQKWCEERSICCVWAGGGWGGRAKH